MLTTVVKANIFNTLYICIRLRDVRTRSNISLLLAVDTFDADVGQTDSLPVQILSSSVGQEMGGL
jgi:hypothetical protein